MNIVPPRHGAAWLSLTVLHWFSSLRFPFFLFLIYSQLESSIWFKKKRKENEKICIAAVNFSSCILLCIVLTQCERFNLFLIISISIPAVH